MRIKLRHWMFLASAFFLGWADEARARVYLTREEAMRLAFGTSATIVEEERPLSPQARAIIERRLGYAVSEQRVTFYVGRAATEVEGYGVVLTELGKHEPITFFIAISPDGHVKDVMVLEYRESRGGEVRQKGFLKQYAGKTSHDPLELDEDITPITGATISARAISAGVKKALVIWEALYR